jgi:hypothetical protein
MEFMSWFGSCLNKNILRFYKYNYRIFVNIQLGAFSQTFEAFSCSINNTVRFKVLVLVQWEKFLPGSDFDPSKPEMIDPPPDIKATF